MVNAPRVIGVIEVNGTKRKDNYQSLHYVTNITAVNWVFGVNGAMKHMTSA